MTDERNALREARRTWGANPAGWSHARQALVGTPEFFTTARERRRSAEVPFLGEAFPFARLRGARALEVGCGAGFDAADMLEAGLDYVGLDAALPNLARTRQHLGGELRVLQASALHLPFPPGSFDLVFSNGVLHHTGDMLGALVEARRVLRPGGQLWLAVYHRDSVFYWLSLVLYSHLWRGGFRVRSLSETLSRIEDTGAPEARPFVEVVSRGELRRRLVSAGFDVDWLRVRRLIAEEFPSRLVRVARCVPPRLLDRLGRLAGWYLVARATARA